MGEKPWVFSKAHWISEGGAADRSVARQNWRETFTNNDGTLNFTLEVREIT